MNELVSIIVPVYNAESFLEECVCSLLRQDYTNIEIVLIDDGSTDHSNNICEKFSNLDSRVRLARIKNGGVSNARNIGLDMASGDLITFVDSDDVIAVDYVSSMVNCMIDSGADVVCSSILQWSPNSDITIPFPGAQNTKVVKKMSSDNALECMLRNRLISSGPYAKLFRNSVIAAERFSKLVIAEDLEYNFRLFNKVEYVVYLDYGTYKYRQNPTGAMRKRFSPERMDAVRATSAILATAIRLKKSYLKAARYRLIRAALHCAGSILESPHAKQNMKYYLECTSIIKKNFLPVALDRGADIKMRGIATLAVINLPLSWKLISSWHRLDLRLKAASRRSEGGSL